MFSGISLGSLPLQAVAKGLRRKIIGPDISTYIATTLPNVPAGRRSAISTAANTASFGQAYTAESVIDDLATLSRWWSADELSTYTDTTGTSAASVGSTIASWREWIGGQLCTQTTTASRPALINTAYGIALAPDGLDDDITVPLSLLPTGTQARTHIFIYESVVTNGFISYGSNTNGRKVDIIASNFQLSVDSQGHRFGNSSAPGIINIASTKIAASQNSDAWQFMRNGASISATSLAGSAQVVDTGNTYARFGRGGGASSYSPQKLYSIMIATSEFSDSKILKIMRFLNAYRGLGLSL